MTGFRGAANRSSPLFDLTIEPVERQTFVSEYFTKSFLRIPGPPGKFRSLLSWDEMGGILEQHCFEPGRLRLVRQGSDLGADLFLLPGRGGRVVNSAALRKHLSEGATLVVNAIHKIVPAIRDVAESIEDVVRFRTQANLYAAWRTQHGFDLHWDLHDVLILQLHGRKHWRVYSHTTVHPLKKDDDVPKPTAPPVWEGILEDGDLVYIPRGWWHMAFPLDEPSLHLTVGILTKRGIDLTRWLVDELKVRPDVRRDLPFCAPEEQRQEFVDRLRSLLRESLDDRGLLTRFLDHTEANTLPRPSVDLSRIGPDLLAPPSFNSTVRLAGARRLSFEPASHEGTMRFHSNDVEWTCSSTLAPALEKLRSNVAVPVQELCAALPRRDDCQKLMAFLTALAMGGVVSVTHENGAV